MTFSRGVGEGRGGEGRGGEGELILGSISHVMLRRCWPIYSYGDINVHPTWN